MRYKYDKNNIYVGTVLDTDLENTTDVRPEDGFYKAKWTGSMWVESATEEEIKASKEENNIITTIDRIDELEASLAELSIALSKKGVI